MQCGHLSFANISFWFPELSAGRAATFLVLPPPTGCRILGYGRCGSHACFTDGNLHHRHAAPGWLLTPSMLACTGYQHGVYTCVCVSVCIVVCDLCLYSCYLYPFAGCAKSIDLNYTRYNLDGHKRQMRPYISIWQRKYLKIYFSATNGGNKIYILSFEFLHFALVSKA